MVTKDQALDAIKRAGTACSQSLFVGAEERQRAGLADLTGPASDCERAVMPMSGRHGFTGAATTYGGYVERMQSPRLYSESCWLVFTC